MQGIKSNNNLFYTCSLIEYIGRQIKRKRYEVVDLLTKERISRILPYFYIISRENGVKMGYGFSKNGV